MIQTFLFVRLGGERCANWS